jgi:hypothetical protein
MPPPLCSLTDNHSHLSLSLFVALSREQNPKFCLHLSRIEPLSHSQFPFSLLLCQSRSSHSLALASLLGATTRPTPRQPSTLSPEPQTRASPTQHPTLWLPFCRVPTPISGRLPSPPLAVPPFGACSTTNVPLMCDVVSDVDWD